MKKEVAEQAFEHALAAAEPLKKLKQRMIERLMG